MTIVEQTQNFNYIIRRIQNLKYPIGLIKNKSITRFIKIRNKTDLFITCLPLKRHFVKQTFGN